MNKKMSINSILILPYSPTLCVYYINDGERHACSYEKINNILSDIVPTLVYKFLEKLSKKLPFYIDVKENTLSDITFDMVELKNKLKKEQKKLTNPNIADILYESTKYIPALEDKKNSILDRIFKK